MCAFETIIGLIKFGNFAFISALSFGSVAHAAESMNPAELKKIILCISFGMAFKAFRFHFYVSLVCCQEDVAISAYKLMKCLL